MLKQRRDHNDLRVEVNIFVQVFKYLDTTLNNQIIMHGKINNRLGSFNRHIYALINLFESKFFTKENERTILSKVILGSTCTDICMYHMDKEKKHMRENCVYLRGKLLGNSMDPC